MNHKTFLRFLRKRNLTYFDVPSVQQRDYLYSLPEPKDDFERSLFQYKCQNFFAPQWIPLLLNIVSLIVYFPLLLFYLLKGLFVRRKYECDAISDLNEMKEVIPSELQSQCKIAFIGANPAGALSMMDIPFLLSVFLRSFPECFFSMKVAMKVAQYSQLVHWYSPRCIIAHLEYSFSSSLLTSYCNMHEIKHINVMHGEKMYNIYDSFFHFNSCYVWNEHYLSLFKDLRAEESQFRVALPPSLCIDTKSFYNPSSWSDYKYYLSNFTEEEIKSIVESMAFVKRKGKSVKYRFHPRYAKKEILYKYVSQAEIEDPHKVSIRESISSCDVAVGAYSTVLLQAFNAGKSVVLDDVTFHHQYVRLEDLKYILITEGCSRLSSLQ